MKKLTEKLWFLTVAACLLATTSMFVVFGQNHRISEESSCELVDVFEEVSVTADRTERRVKRKARRATTSNSLTIAKKTVRPSSRFFSSAKERDHLNGMGGYLLI